MPKRSNEFQRLVHDIHRQLHESATVRESVLVPDHNNGPPLEVDILIEDKSGEYPLVIGVECIDHKRPADIGWVLQMSKKHANRTDKLVLVSGAGFTKNALKEAADNGIITLNLSDALDADWTEFVNRIRAVGIGMFSFKVEQGYGIVDKGDGIKPYKVAPELVLHEIDGRPLCTAGEYANYILNHPDVVTHLMDRIRAQPDLQWGRFETEMKDEVMIEEAGGMGHLLRAFRLDISWTASFASMDLKANMFGNIPVAWGNATVEDQKLDFVATERKGKGVSATLRAKSDGDKESRLVELQPVPESPLKYKILEVSEEDFFL